MHENEISSPKSTAINGGWSEEQRAEILREAERILSHPAFKASKRCVALLKRVVHHALDGDAEGIKERVLGSEVFGRPSNYDTSADPIVRMTANEIRKRLAQYYQEPSNERDVTIRLSPGTYTPQFDFSSMDDGDTDAAVAAPAEVQPPTPENQPLDVAPETTTEERPSFLRRSGLWGSLGLAAAAMFFVFYHIVASKTPQEAIWAPLLQSKKPVMICMADLNDFPPSMRIPLSGDDWPEIVAKYLSTREAPLVEQPSKEAGPHVPFVDTEVATRVTAWLAQHRRQSNLRIDNSLTLDDFRQGPVVIVGAINNPWCITLLSDLRYHFRFDPTSRVLWIEDAQNVSNRGWAINIGSTSFSQSGEDYAILSRVFIPSIGNWVVGVSGMGVHATNSAGELLTDPAWNASLPRSISEKKNLQIVMKTTVIDGHTGSPQILAVYSW